VNLQGRLHVLTLACVLSWSCVFLFLHFSPVTAGGFIWLVTPSMTDASFWAKIVEALSSDKILLKCFLFLSIFHVIFCWFLKINSFELSSGNGSQLLLCEYSRIHNHWQIICQLFYFAQLNLNAFALIMEMA